MEKSVKIVGHRSRFCNRHHGATAHRGLLLRRSQLRLSLLSWAFRSAVATELAVPSWMAVVVPSPAWPAMLSAPFQRRGCGRAVLTRQRRSFRSGVTAALRPIVVSPAPTLVATCGAVPQRGSAPNPAVDLVRFALWTLRDEAAQRRSPLLLGVMIIELYRHAGYFGRSVPLDVLVDGQWVAVLKADQKLSISLPDAGANLQVSLQGTVFSPIVAVCPNSHHQKFECGTPFWVLIDILSLCYLPVLKQRVFFLRQVANA